MSVSSGSISNGDNNSDIGDFSNLANTEGDDTHSVSSERVQSQSQQQSYQQPYQDNSRQSNAYQRESSPAEINRKRDYLVKLHDLKAKGIHLTGSYNMDTPVDDLMLECDRHVKTQQKNNSLAFSKNALMLGVQGLEMMSMIDPFGLSINLNGWTNSVNPDQYEDILEELIEKYSGPATSSPEF